MAHLRVVNLGVLEDAAIDPGAGFTVITGETGAGKTLLLGGLRLILGGPADAGAVGPYGTEARIDGLFVDGDDETGVSRVVPREGRSRAYLEGGIVSAAALGEEVGSNVEIVGQHDQIAMTRPARLLELIDGALDDDGIGARTEYDRAWKAHQDALARRAQLGGDQTALARELDLARYQAAEIAEASLQPGMDSEIEGAVSRLRNVEEISEHLAETHRAAEEMSESIGEMVARLRKAAGLDPDLAGVASEAEGLAESIADLARETRDRAEQIEADPKRLEELESQLNVIGELKRKYGRTLDEVIAYGEQAAKRADELDALLGDADRIDALVSRTSADLTRAGSRLTKARLDTGVRIAAEMKRHLHDLGLGKAVVSFVSTPTEPTVNGTDGVRMLFASDERLEPGPLNEVASGGELSRLVLSMRLATSTVGSGTLVFDEVDTGIGGATALAMGDKIGALAAGSQVLCVTHLAQVAAQADVHYVVERSDGGAAEVRRVEGDERIAELARMLSGQPDSEAGRSTAQELVARAGK